MTELMKVVAWFSTEGPTFAAAILGVLTALITLFMLIPGEQPEKGLQKFVDFITKFSRK